MNFNKLLVIAVSFMILFSYSGFSLNIQGNIWTKNDKTINGISTLDFLNEDKAVTWFITPEVFTLNGKKYMIITFHDRDHVLGYKWNGDEWTRNDFITNGLRFKQNNPTARVFNIEDRTYLMEGGLNGDLVLHRWDGDEWNYENTLSIKMEDGDYIHTRHNMRNFMTSSSFFRDSGKLYMISAMDWKKDEGNKYLVGLEVNEDDILGKNGPPHVTNKPEVLEGINYINPQTADPTYGSRTIVDTFEMDNRQYLIFTYDSGDKEIHEWNPVNKKWIWRKDMITGLVTPGIDNSITIFENNGKINLIETNKEGLVLGYRLEDPEFI